MTLLDHTYAYSVFANQGVMIGQPVPAEELQSGFRTLDPVSVLLVSDSDGNIVDQYTNEEAQAERIFSAEVAYVMADIMSDDVARAPALWCQHRPNAARPQSCSQNGHNKWLQR